MAKQDIDVEALRADLDYDPETGIFTWRRAIGPRVQIGMIAGYKGNNARYWHIQWRGHDYTLHRLAYFYVYGKWPANHLDHRDGDTCNNRISNIRDATRTQNMGNRRISKNNTSGFKGVCRAKRPAGKWCAKIGAGDKRIFLGYFDTAEAAHDAYMAAARIRFGEFARAA